MRNEDFWPGCVIFLLQRGSRSRKKINLQHLGPVSCWLLSPACVGVATGHLQMLSCEVSKPPLRGSAWGTERNFMSSTALSGRRKESSEHPLSLALESSRKGVFSSKPCSKPASRLVVVTFHDWCWKNFLSCFLGLEVHGTKIWWCWRGLIRCHWDFSRRAAVWGTFTWEGDQGSRERSREMHSLASECHSV